MKVFISWSGDRSNKIAEVLKQWIKHVIQTVEPFVSSQDVSKGARWSSDIAKELQDTNFGILCVTKDNYQQPWLLFEAGALSKTIEKSYVVPLLFDLGPSDLQDSPLLQFQATSNSKEEIKKLIITINSACEASPLDTKELDETFEVWYPKLLENLSKIEIVEEGPAKTEKQSAAEKTSQILEELLELTRMNQKLLRNTEAKASEENNDIFSQLMAFLRRAEERELTKLQMANPLMALPEGIRFEYSDSIVVRKYAILASISIYKDSFPWLYDSVSEIIDTMLSTEDVLSRRSLLSEFVRFVDTTIRFAVKYDLCDKNYKSLKIIKDIPDFLFRSLERLC